MRIPYVFIRYRENHNRGCTDENLPIGRRKRKELTGLRKASSVVGSACAQQSNFFAQRVMPQSHLSVIYPAKQASSLKLHLSPELLVPKP